MTEEIMLTIGLITYNHAKYVKQALDGIIMQKTDFKYEVVVGDDASDDGTQEILKQYSEMYPDIFHLILREKNIGATKNNYDIKQYARGKYFACLEGDDFWIDSQKLQIQVDFLESHPEYVACVHKCMFVDEFGNQKENQPINGYYYNEEIFTIKQFERGLLPGQTATLMYRNIFLDEEKDFSIMYTANQYIADKTAILILLSYSNIYCIDKVMSCYRYVIEENGRNVSSKYIGKNNRDELMEYLTILEQYAKKELNMDLDMSYKKKNYFVAAVTVWMREPTNENERIVRRMLELSGNAFSYKILKYKTKVFKWISWTILKRDIKIKV